MPLLYELTAKNIGLERRRLVLTLLASGKLFLCYFLSINEIICCFTYFLVKRATFFYFLLGTYCFKLMLHRTWQEHSSKDRALWSTVNIDQPPSSISQ